MSPRDASRGAEFRALHRSDTFVIPNPFDVGSARLLQHLGYLALATTSSGFAATLGRLDQNVARDELVDHVASICKAVDIPVHVDAEDCYPGALGGVTRTIELLAGAGASGVSIEDYDSTTRSISERDAAAAKVAEAASACRRHAMVLTARAEQVLYGSDDVDDTIDRLRTYVAAGADVVYAPGLSDIDDIARCVDTVDVPVNVLLVKGGPDVTALSSVGVRRVSTGGGLAWASYGGLVAAATELRDAGTTDYLRTALSSEMRHAAFGRRWSRGETNSTRMSPMRYSPSTNRQNG